VFAYGLLSLTALAVDAAVLFGITSMSLGATPRIGAQLLGLFWLSLQWKIVAPAYRVVGGVYRSAGTVVGYHFVPFYNVYWLFAVQRALCTGLDAGLDAAGYPRTAPRTLAIVAPVAQLGCALAMRLMPNSPLFLVPAIVQSVLWLLYMVYLERTSREVARLWGIQP